MSDYFDNLVVRSFRPLLPVQPLLAPTPEVPHALAPSTPEEFEDPFAQATVAGDQLTEEPEQPPASGDPSPEKNTKLRPPVIKDRRPSEAALFENDRRLKTPARSVESSTGLEPVAPRNQRIPHSSDEALPTPARIPTSNAGPLVGKPLQPSSDEPLDPSKPPSSTPARDVTRSEFRPAPVKRSAEINSALPLSSSPQQAVAPPRKKLSAPGQGSPPSFQRAPSLEQPTPSSAIERVVVQRITETIEKDQSTPAPLTTLIPRPGAELLLPPTHKARSNLLPSAPNATGADGPLPETIINVSIGRIEVCATPPKATRPEKQRNAPQVMNLDEYLRQRSGGSR
ncbi:MAG: hypothetical protein AABN33_05090 [Acidobacteriota bacterium]